MSKGLLTHTKYPDSRASPQLYVVLEFQATLLILARTHFSHTVASQQTNTLYTSCVASNVVVENLVPKRDKYFFQE